MIGLIVALFSVLLPLAHLALSRSQDSRASFACCCWRAGSRRRRHRPAARLRHMSSSRSDRAQHRLGAGSRSSSKSAFTTAPGAFSVSLHLDPRRFWLATGLGWSLFMLGATYGHIEQTLRAGDYAPYNF
jgi:hypothetical protein